MGASLSVSNKLSEDSEVKIYRQLKSEFAHLKVCEITDEATIFQKLSQKHEQLMRLYTTNTFSCPKTR